MNFSDRYPETEDETKRREAGSKGTLRNIALKNAECTSYLARLPSTDILWTIQRELIIRLAMVHNGDRQVIAKKMGISYKTLQNYISRIVGF